MPKVSKPCAGCGATFESWPNHDRKFCGRACSAEYGAAGRKPGVVPTGKAKFSCARCAAEYETWPSQAGKYCSRLCFDLARRDRITFECAVCGKARTVKAGTNFKYCSQRCRGEGMSSKPLTVCPCGEPTKTRGRTFCSPGCRAAATVTRIEVPCSCCGKPTQKTPIYLQSVENPCCSYRCSRAMQRFDHASKIGTAAIDAWAASESCLWQPEYLVGWYRIDLALPLEHIAIELDGEYWHGREGQRERDIARDAWLNRHGWAVRRVIMRAEHRNAPTVVAGMITKAIRSARREQRNKMREIA